MDNEMNKLDDNLVVSGGGKKWSEDEERYLFRCAPNYCHGSGYDWDAVSEDINSVYHNGRTAKACEQRFFKHGGDNRIDIGE